jgi:hypothetical protein
VLAGAERVLKTVKPGMPTSCLHASHSRTHPVHCFLFPEVPSPSNLANTAATMGPTAQYRVDNEGVAVITLANPPVNALHPAGA